MTLQAKGPFRMTLSARGRAALIGAAVLLVLLLIVLIWRLGPGRAVSEEQIAAAHIYQATEQLRDDERLAELPQSQQDELRAELEAQLEAMGRPADRVYDAASEQPTPPGVSPAEHAPGLPGAFLASARMIQQTPAESPEQQAVWSATAAHRAATALELGADAAVVERTIPSPSAEDALPAAEDQEDSPVAAGESAHPELVLARRLGQAQDAAETWALLPSGQRPASQSWAQALDPVLDSEWLRAVQQRHPSVLDGAPGMPQDFRTSPEAARDALLSNLQTAAVAQAADAADEDREGPRSSSPEAGTAVLMRLSVDQACSDQPVGALPGLQD